MAEDGIRAISSDANGVASAEDVAHIAAERQADVEAGTFACSLPQCDGRLLSGFDFS